MSEKVEWLPILAELGESVVARIIENSPDVKSAILAGRENFQAAGKEADELGKMGHEEEEPVSGEVA
jgi:hypothetical protein